MDRITKGYLKTFADSQELEYISDESRLFEMFSCYCVLSHEYGETFSLDDIITGGGNDSGIDGMAIIADGVIIQSTEEFDDLIEQTHNISELKFIFVQAKTSASFSGSDIATFGFGVRDLFKETPELVQSALIQEKAIIIAHIFDNMVHVKGKPKCLLYYVTNGQWCNDQNLRARIDGVCGDLESDNLFSDVRFFPIDIDLLQKYYKSTIDRIEAELDLPDKITLPEMGKIQEAYLGILPATRFLKLVSNDTGVIKSILYDNVRDFQGENEEINREIAQTLNGEDSDQFVVLNNGITIICKELRNLVRTRFLLSDYQIVNGCQTSHVLYNYRKKLTDKVFVVVKIISTTDEETVNRIIKATNRQTVVTDEQMMSLSEFNKQLEAFYQTYEGQQRLYYERRSKQYANMPSIEKVRIVTIPIQIKAVSSMFFDKPHLASRYYGRLLNDNANIFNPSHPPVMYYTAAFVLYKVEFLIRNKQIDQKYNRYRYHLLMIIKYLALEGKRCPQFNSHSLERLCEKILEIANESNEFLKMVLNAAQILNDNISNLASPEEAKTLATVEKIQDLFRQKSE